MSKRIPSSKSNSYRVHHWRVKIATSRTGPMAYIAWRRFLFLVEDYLCEREGKSSRQKWEDMHPLLDPDTFRLRRVKLNSRQVQGFLGIDRDTRGCEEGRIVQLGAWVEDGRLFFFARLIAGPANFHALLQFLRARIGKMCRGRY